MLFKWSYHRMLVCFRHKYSRDFDMVLFAESLNFPDVMTGAGAA